MLSASSPSCGPSYCACRDPATDAWYLEIKCQKTPWLNDIWRQNRFVAARRLGSKLMNEELKGRVALWAAACRARSTSSYVNGEKPNQTLFACLCYSVFQLPLQHHQHTNESMIWHNFKWHSQLGTDCQLYNPLAHRRVCPRRLTDISSLQKLIANQEIPGNMCVAM